MVTTIDGVLHPPSSIFSNKDSTYPRYAEILTIYKNFYSVYKKKTWYWVGDSHNVGQQQGIYMKN